MVRIYSTIGNFLVVLIEMFDKVFAFKDAIVSKIIVDDDTMIKCHSFKGLFGSD